MAETKYGKTALIEDITSATQGISRAQVETVLTTALQTIQAKLQAGQNVTLTGFGTFRTSQRAARVGTNIRTKQKINIPAQTSVRFTPGSDLKAAVKGGGGQYARERAAGQQTTQRGRAVPQR